MAKTKTKRKQQKPQSKYTEEQKAQAIAIAMASTIRDASKQTGIPTATIGAWVAKIRAEQNLKGEPAKTARKARVLAQKAMEEAKEEVKEVVVTKTLKIADKMLDVLAKAVEETEKALASGPKEEEYMSTWLRALISAISQLTEKHLLLTGQPTSRQAIDGQVTNREEYYIEHHLQTDPESAELLKQLYRRQQILAGTGED